MLSIEMLQEMHAKLQQGLRQCQADEAAAMERRLRQEGALLAMERLLNDAQEQRGGESQPIDVSALAIPLATEDSNG